MPLQIICCSLWDEEAFFCGADGSGRGHGSGGDELFSAKFNPGAAGYRGWVGGVGGGRALTDDTFSFTFLFATKQQNEHLIWVDDQMSPRLVLRNLLLFPHIPGANKDKLWKTWCKRRHQNTLDGCVVAHNHCLYSRDTVFGFCWNHRLHGYID